MEEVNPPPAATIGDNGGQGSSSSTEQATPTAKIDNGGLGSGSSGGGAAAAQDTLTAKVDNGGDAIKVDNGGNGGGGAAKAGGPKARLNRHSFFAQYQNASGGTGERSATSTTTSVTTATTTSTTTASVVTNQPTQSTTTAVTTVVTTTTAPATAIATATASATATEWDFVEQRELVESSGERLHSGHKPPQPQLEAITYAAALAFFFGDEAWQTKPVTHPVARDRSCLTRLLTPKLDATLHRERAFVYYLQTVSLNHGVAAHTRILLTIYRHCTGETREGCSSGSHLQRIGFQGNDPATDLRSSGMYSLLQCLYFVTSAPETSLAYYRASASAAHDFPFVLCSINFTTVVLDLLRDKRLHRLANAQQSVLRVMNQVYVGIFVRFFEVWTSKASRSIAEWDGVRRELKAAAVRAPREFFNLGGSVLPSTSR